MNYHNIIMIDAWTITYSNYQQPMGSSIMGIFPLMPIEWHFESLSYRQRFLALFDSAQVVLNKVRSILEYTVDFG